MYIHIYIHVFTRIWFNEYIHMCMHVYVCARVYIWIYVHMCVYILMCSRSRSRSRSWTEKWSARYQWSKKSRRSSTLTGLKDVLRGMMSLLLRCALPCLVVLLWCMNLRTFLMEWCRYFWGVYRLFLIVFVTCMHGRSSPDDVVNS